MKSCPICNSDMGRAFKAVVLRKYEVDYFQCPQCGLLQTEEPYWLDEAYGDAIAVADTGLVQRNISIARELAVLLYFEFDSKAAYLDVAGGYGMMTRLMRDFGFDFYWDDKFCQNQLARGFEADKAIRPFAAMTAFEVLEHVHDPLAFIRTAMEQHSSRSIIFSTLLYEGAPPPSDWWYYAFNTGQHISFYQSKTLQILAERLGVKSYSAHGIHIFTDQPISKKRMQLLTGRLVHPLSLYVKRRMVSRTLTDHHMLMNTMGH